MRKPSQYRVLPFLVVAACLAVGALAIFTGGASESKEVDDGRPARETGRAWNGKLDVTAARISSVLKNYGCPQCSSRIEWGSDACPRCGWRRGDIIRQAALNTNTPTTRPRENVAVRMPAITRAAARPTTPALPSPREQDAAGKEFIEGHWLGLEVITLVPELAREYGVPKGQAGVLVDEVTLEAAESGILAGDTVQSVGGHPTPDLKSFFLATQRVREERQAKVGVSRRGSKTTFVIATRNTNEMGPAQMEAAQPILPGSISPHRSRGRPCTDCHIIMRTGGQLPTDAGDILPNPPPIAVDARAPHGDRGRCSTCHVIAQPGGKRAMIKAGAAPTAPAIARNAASPHGDWGPCATCHVIR